MEDKGTKKKVTRVKSDESKKDSIKGNETTEPTKKFVATEEAKSETLKWRLIAAFAWVVALAAEVFAIIKLKEVPVNMAWLIGLIIVALIGAVVGSMLWKKANRLDPASEKDKVRFFIQNQLGLIISVLAFLPLVILIFTNKDMKGKEKGIVGAVAVVALLIASYVGLDLNPASVEQYTQQIQEVEELSGQNSVYWTKFGTRYHLYSDCQHINTDKTDEILEGTVQQARELKNIAELCGTCKKRKIKENESKTEEAHYIEFEHTHIN